MKTTDAAKFIHIEIAELVAYSEEREGDWHYCGSKVNEKTGSQRTETYYTTRRGTSKLRNGSVYLDYGSVKSWQHWQHDPSFEIPHYSPLYYKRIDNSKLVPSVQNPKKMKPWRLVSKELFGLHPNWPLLTVDQLQKTNIPAKLIEIIRP